MSNHLAVAGTTVTLVDIRIEHVSIEGFGRRDGFAVRLALQRNLVRLIQEHGPPSGWTTDTTREEVVAAGLNWDGRGGDDGLGSALARQIYDTFAS